MSARTSAFNDRFRASGKIRSRNPPRFSDKTFVTTGWPRISRSSARSAIAPDGDARRSRPLLVRANEREFIMEHLVSDRIRPLLFPPQQHPLEVRVEFLRIRPVNQQADLPFRLIAMLTRQRHRHVARILVRPF